MSVQNQFHQLGPVASHIITHLIHNEPIKSKQASKIQKIVASLGALTVVGVGALPYVSPNMSLVEDWDFSEQNEVMAKILLVGGNVTCFTFLSSWALWQLLGHSFHAKSSHELEIARIDNGKTNNRQKNAKLAALSVAAVTRIPEVAVAVVFSKSLPEKIFLATCSATTVAIPWMSTYHTLNRSYKKLCSSEGEKKINCIREAFLMAISLKRQSLIKNGLGSDNINQLLDRRDIKNWSHAEVESFLDFISEISQDRPLLTPQSKLDKSLSISKSIADISIGSTFAMTILAINFALTFDLCKELGTDDVTAGISSTLVSTTLLYFLFSAFIRATQSHTDTLSSACRGRVFKEPAAQAYPVTTTFCKAASLMPVAFCWGPVTEFCKTYFNQNDSLENFMIASSTTALVLLFSSLLPQLTESALQSSIKKYGNRNARNFLEGVHLLDEVSAFVSALPEGVFTQFALSNFSDRLLEQCKTTREELRQLLDEHVSLNIDELTPLNEETENV